MKKPIIAVDIDDVLADSTESVRLAINKLFNLNLERHHYQIPGEYWGYYEYVWQQHGIEMTLAKLDTWHEANRLHVPAYTGAKPALTELSKTYEIVTVTARHPEHYDMTQEWLAREFGGVIRETIFVGKISGDRKKSKGLVCKELGVTWLLDDHVEHTNSAHAEGVNAVLFGQYGWQQNIPDHTVRCLDWPSVMEHLRERS